MKSYVATNWIIRIILKSRVVVGKHKLVSMLKLIYTDGANLCKNSS